MTYLLQSSADGGQTWATLADNQVSRLSSTATTAQITGLIAGKNYSFRVAAVNALGTSDWSTNSIQALTVSSPSSGTSVFVTKKTATTVSLAWAAPGSKDYPVQSYVVKLSTDNGFTWAPIAPQNVQFGTDVPTTATISGLTRGTSYLFSVAPVTTQGVGSAVTIGEPVIPAVLPSAPGAAFMTGRTVNSISLNWAASPDNGGRPLIGYDIRISSNGGNTWSTEDTGWISRNSPTDTNATITNLVMGTTYLFQVAAVSPEGAGEWSTVSSPMLAAEVPNLVTGVRFGNSLVHDPISIAWQAPAANGSAITNFLIEFTANSGLSWSRIDDSAIVQSARTATSASISGLLHGISYGFRVFAVNSVGIGGAGLSDSSVVCAVPPSAPRTIRVVNRTVSTVNLSWAVPLDSGGQPVLSYEVRASNNGGQTWQQGGLTNAVVAIDGGTGTVSGLVTGKQYIFSVRAVNVEGAGPWSGSSEAAQTSTAPDAITTLAVATDKFGDPDLADDYITFNWSPPLANGSAITKYTMQISDDGTTWSTPVVLTPSTTTYTISNLQQSQARLIRIFASNAEGDGPMSEDFVVTTGGLPQMTVSVVDTSGLPVTGGAITWAMDDGSARSVVTYGLTADGIIQFPGAPAGRVTVTLQNAQMSDGSTVSGQWHAVLGLKSNVLQVPLAPAVAIHTAHVILSSGQSLSNVQVEMSGMDDLNTSVNTAGFTFTLPKVTALSGLTDVNGNFSVWGFSNHNPYVQVKYDDGVISQTKAGQMTSPLETIKLRSLPFASFDSGSVRGSLGVPIPVVVSAGFGSGSALRGLRSVGLNSTVSSGVQVTLVGPAGAKLTSCSSAKVKPVLSAKTDASGKARLLVCPTRSGVYTLRTKGALSVGSVNVLVKGAAPFAVNSVTVRCPVPGVVHTSWNKPIFDGGAPVTKYIVTLSAVGKKTVTKTLLAKMDAKGKVLKVPATVLDVSGLANATTYSVRITAVTVNGVSDAYTTTIPVA